MVNEFLAAQVVKHPTKDRWYYVSTINRYSSADFYPHHYAETIVFEWDVENQKKVRILKQDECGDGSTWKHDLIVSSLRLKGMNAFWDDEEDE